MTGKEHLAPMNFKKIQTFREKIKSSVSKMNSLKKSANPKVYL